MGLHGSLYRHPHLLLSGLVIGSEYMSVVVRHHHFAGIARAYLAAADNERYLPLLGCERWSAFLSSAFSSEPGAYPFTGSLHGF